MRVWVTARKFAEPEPGRSPMRKKFQPEPRCGMLPRKWRKEMDIKKVCRTIEDELNGLFEEVRSGIPAREDSRAFGGMIQERIMQHWSKFCRRHGFGELKEDEMPGRRTIFDVAFRHQGLIVGIDVKTKDLDSARYSDGGICAVGNLLKYLANDRGVFIIAEFGHNKSSDKVATRDLEYIRVAPFTLLPANSYRIENLGTGQVRLNYTLNQVWDEIEWDRDIKAFYDVFTDLAIKHYHRVGRDAQRRIDSIIAFKKNGYETFRFMR